MYIDDQGRLVIEGNEATAAGSKLVATGITELYWTADDNSYTPISTTIFNADIHQLTDDQSFTFIGSHQANNITTNTTAEYTDVYTGDGDDIITISGSGESWVASGGGSDEVHGGSGNDIIYGDGVNNWQAMDNAGDDHLMGHDGDDELHGGLGNDTLMGQVMTFCSEDGDDILINQVQALKPSMVVLEMTRLSSTLAEPGFDSVISAGYRQAFWSKR